MTENRRSKPDLLIRRNAFTLVEIMLVIVIMGIVAAIAIPMLSKAGSVQVRAAAEMVAADMEYAKSMAISRQQNYTVDFDTAAESYSIKDKDGVIITHPVKTDFDYTIDFTADSRISSVKISTADFNSTTQVTFDRLGAPDNAGTITLTADGITATVTVEAVTGYVSITY